MHDEEIFNFPKGYVEKYKIIKTEEGPEWDKFKKLMKVVMPLASQLKRGESVITKCPDCHEGMTILRSKSNGHLHVFCENCGVKICS